MPDLPYGSDDIIKGFFSKIPDTMMEAEAAMNFALGRMVTSVHDVLKEGLGDKMASNIKKQMDAARTPIEQMVAQARDMIKNLGAAEELKTKLFNTYEQIRLKDFNKNSQKEREILEKSFTDSKKILEEKFGHQFGIDKKIQELQKEHDKTMAEFQKQANKEKKKLELEAQASTGNFGAGMKLAIGGMAESAMEFAKMGGPAWFVKTALEQASQTSMAAGKLTASKVMATGNITGGLVDNTSNLASGVSPAVMGNVERMQLAAKIYSQAPRLIGESAEAFRGLTGYLGNFGMGIEQTSDLLISANKDLGYSADDLTDTFGKAAMSAKELGLSVLDVAELSMEMVGSLRLVGLGTKESIAIMRAIPTKTDMGAVTASDLQAYSKAMSSFFGNLSPSTISGMTMFLKGGGMPMGGDLTASAKNTPQMMSQMYTQMRDSMAGQVDNRVFAEQFTKSMGINIPNTMAGTEVFDKLATGLPDEISKTFSEMGEKFKSSDQYVEMGYGKLVQIAGVMESIDKVLKELFVPLSSLLAPLLKAVTGLGGMMGSETNGINGTHVLGAAASGAAIGSMFGPWGIPIGAVIGAGGEVLFGSDGVTPQGNSGIGQ